MVSLRCSARVVLAGLPFFTVEMIVAHWRPDGPGAIPEWGIDDC